MATLKTLSVFFPAYNEEDNIAATVSKAIIILEGLNLAGYEIIVVDDGSSDRTAEIVENLAKKNSRIRLVRHQRNRGYGAALKTGFSSAKFSWVAFTDSDGQFDFHEINKFLDFIPDYQVIIGYRKHRCDSKFRRLMAFLLRVWDTTLFGLNLKDVDCGFKLIKKSVIDRVFPLATESAITETEMMAKIHRAGFSIKQTGVAHHSRTEGIQTGGNFKVILKAFIESLKLFLHFNPAFTILIAIMAVSAFLRLYRIRDYIVFLGDEGRDALVWFNMVEKGKFTLLGPTASVGGFYLGPIYYYLTLPFYWVWRDPVGPAIFVALIGIATVWLIWFLSKNWFSRTAAIIAAAVYSTTALVIRYSRSSWNPNPLPFFSLAGLYLVSVGSRSRKLNRIFFSGICLGIAIQLHYLSLILIPIFILIIFVKSFSFPLPVVPEHQRRIRNLFKYFYRFPIRSGMTKFVICFLLLFAGFIAGFSPFLIFEIRHNFPNSKNVIEFITRPGKGVFNFEITGLVRSLMRNIYRLFYIVLSWPDSAISKILIFIAAMGGMTAAIKKRRWEFMIWFLGGMIIFSLYQGSIADYYYGLFFTAPAILFGASSQLFWKYRYLRSLIALGMVFYVLDQSNRWFTNFPPNRLLIQTENISSNIVRLSAGKPYNFALITKGNSDHAYRYFLEKSHSQPIALEKQIAEQLIVVCEKPEPECQPLGNPIWEIAGFGRAEIGQQISLPPEITVYKLVHYLDN